MTELIYVVNDELKNKLTHHKGIIPIYLIPLIDRREYDNNLKKHGIYEEVYEEYNQIRLNRKRSKDKEKFDIDEFYSWIEKNEWFKKYLK